MSARSRQPRPLRPDEIVEAVAIGAIASTQYPDEGNRETRRRNERLRKAHGGQGAVRGTPCSVVMPVLLSNRGEIRAEIERRQRNARLAKLRELIEGSSP